MSWAADSALDFITKKKLADVEKINTNILRLSTEMMPNVIAYISGLHEINGAEVTRIVSSHPDIDFVCGYRNSCIWHGEAIGNLTDNNIGWGNLGTLLSAADNGNANVAEHKVFKWASDALGRLEGIQVEREYDRVFNIVRFNGTVFRLVMSKEYEPSADVVRELWKRFGPFDAVYNIDPNVRPTGGGYKVAQELGIEILGHSEIFRRIRGR